MAKSSQLSVHMPLQLYRKFTRAAERLGVTKSSAVRKMIEDFLLNTEATPTYFERYKKQSESRTKRTH